VKQGGLAAAGEGAIPTATPHRVSAVRRRRRIFLSATVR
jgi:hypothetical protein